MQVSRGGLTAGSLRASRAHEQGGKRESVLSPGLSKMDFQDLTATLLLDIRWIQPEAHGGLESPHFIEENTDSTGLQFPVVTLWQDGK